MLRVLLCRLQLAGCLVFCALLGVLGFVAFLGATVLLLCGLLGALLLAGLSRIPRATGGHRGAEAPRLSRQQKSPALQ